LDLFAGTGAIGIEALSRGANFVRFIDKNRSAVETIQANLEHTRLSNIAEVFKMDSFIHLRQIPDKLFHYIYVAPPQYKNLWQDALSEIDSHPGWLATDSWVIVQIDPKEYSPRADQHFKEFEQRRYGTTLLVFYERVNPQQT
jgi:16S rRNA (guanine(966)-N(2))-methyltransferase RsmD